jgi:hypothetical protein
VTKLIKTIPAIFALSFCIPVMLMGIFDYHPFDEDPNLFFLVGMFVGFLYFWLKENIEDYLFKKAMRSVEMRNAAICKIYAMHEEGK